MGCRRASAAGPPQKGHAPAPDSTRRRGVFPAKGLRRRGISAQASRQGAEPESWAADIRFLEQRTAAAVAETATVSEEAAAEEEEEELGKARATGGTLAMGQRT